MPPPTNINVAVELYSKRFIPRLMRRLAPLHAFTMNFTDEFVESPGDTINVPLLEADTVAQWNQASNNYRRVETDVATRPLKLTRRPIAGFAISQKHLHNFFPHWWEEKGNLNARAIAKDILDDVYSHITPENYGHTADTNIVWSPSTFTLKSVGELRTKVVERGMDGETATLCLSPGYYSTLLTLLDASIKGSDSAIRRGILDGVLGFMQIVEVPGYNGPGFVCNQNALLVGSRRIMAADLTPYKLFTSMVEPATGLHLNSVVYTDGATAVTSYSTEALFGYQTGEENSLIRMVTEMPTPPPAP